MKPVNTVKVTFPSKSANEAFARSVAASFAAQADPAADEIAELKTAVSEAVTNCIVHAYKDCIGKITMTVSLYEDDTIAVTVADTGVGIPDIKKAMEPLYTTGGDERAGLGFAVMESFADKVRVRSKQGRGTSVTLMKQLGKK
ncbi:MAG: anti-sigma F factor [Clostridia bacterium]|nr:anti-sigma F factor [Clostridia bacterium]NLS86111.1 anti-sigma F factor [Oscillospiraceae bacterium]